MAGLEAEVGGDDWDFLGGGGGPDHNVWGGGGVEGDQDFFGGGDGAGQYPVVFRRGVDKLSVSFVFILGEVAWFSFSFK